MLSVFFTCCWCIVSRDLHLFLARLPPPPAAEGGGRCFGVQPAQMNGLCRSCALRWQHRAWNLPAHFPHVACAP